ncbi:hypothetical protein EA472_22700 [Natrarchaeobius oligotrophus]|uniref:Uncharacterized protein n=1 Tax=Natrarchaeobius chitinivorans TaxID=1679083 RepID=A0A3N6MI80_NATCH|nr:hypothetical protein EA472_22700 [Natrarchaeobius chitinivorans]
MTPREPTIYDRTKIETDEQCPMYRGDGPDPCTNTAEYLFVYEASIDPDDDRRRNCLACADCVPEPTIS